MKIIKVLALLALSLTAHAEHHRGHAIMHMDNSLRFLDAAMTIAQAARDNTETSALAAQNLDKYLIYAGKYHNRIAAAKDVLASGGDLEEARRLVSAPGVEPELESADYGLAATVSILAVAVREGANDQQMSLILTRHSKAAQFFGWAHWHVIDAIREEVYADPVFICSGSGNHCE